jgi:hypothetical protein
LKPVYKVSRVSNLTIGIFARLEAKSSHKLLFLIDSLVLAPPHPKSLPAALRGEGLYSRCSSAFLD